MQLKGTGPLAEVEANVAQNGAGHPTTRETVVGEGQTAPRTPGTLRRTFSSLGDPTYRLLWFGMVLQMAGMHVQMLAQGYFIYELTGSKAMLGFVSVATAIGTPLILFGGVLADRVEKKKLIMIGQVFFIALPLAVGLSIATGTITWQYLLVASLVQGLVMPFVMPARQSIVPQVVKREQLMNAMALNAMGMSVTTMAAPAVAGMLIDAIGVEGAYYIVAGLNVASLLFMARVPKLTEHTRGAPAPVFSSIVEGFSYLRSNVAVLLLILLGLSQMMLMMPVRQVLPIFAKDVFSVGPDGLGWMMSAMGLGSFAGALLVAALGHIGRRGFVLVSLGICSGVLLLGFSAASYFIPVFALALAFMVVVGAVQSGQMSMQGSLSMEYIAPTYRGRVTSINMLGFGLMPLGVLPLTLIAEITGAPIALGIMSTIFIGVAVVIMAFSPRLRRLK